MESYTPIQVLKNKLADLKSMSGIESNLIVEYEKAILVLEFVGDAGSVDKANEPVKINDLDSKVNNKPQEESKSYYEKFMEAQRNKNSK